MDERQLVYAAAIEKAGSLRQAARELDREYSTLARSLKRLEEELGSPLFRRGSLGLRTTSEGEAFFAWARQALGVFRKMGRKQEGNLTEREMEYLLRIRREKGIARAAQSLYIAQPSLSQILMKLEEECGFALFTREKDGVRETNEGSRFLDQVEELAGIYRKMRRQLEEFQQLKRGLVSFGIPINLGTSLLPDILPRFSALYPGVEVRFFENNSVELDRMVLEGRTDFNIMHFQSPKETLEYEILGVDPFCLAAPSSWGERLGLKEGAIGKRELKELEPEPFIMVARGQKLRQTADEILSQAQVKPKVLCSTKSMETAKRLVAAGMGLTLLPMSYTTLLSDRKGILCVPISEELEASWKIVIAYPKGEELPCCCREFLRLLRQRMKERQQNQS
ncbi:MAG TPA: LysR family transcriptional regulator [Candidatus Enterocloster excrementigallinarum]|uniref:LysR family transcriptional regulator n=1 Tax=Candidatus Enterocloster excrementigallinarum TaxID=2838558 RepID=A0A9D2PUT7_9FIRM|nr:LysR family transcriptional regulator [Candidatus Enterocloster excrementigallinarum]